MPLTKPNQELRRDRKAAFKLRHADTLALMMLISGPYAGDRIGTLADDVKEGLCAEMPTAV